MKVAFRTDASLQIGTGHVMRCLTLATALRDQGAEVIFITCNHEGNLDEHIKANGFAVHSLSNAGVNASRLSLVGYAQWLGVDQITDAEATIQALGSMKPDWLIVDHYALDCTWEKKLAGSVQKIMVIDDLCDRRHDCNLLLDQNLGRSKTDYVQIVTKDCTVLTGPKYAMLRPEFSLLREASVKRRAAPVLKKILITMGGVDQNNATGKTLEALRSCPIIKDCQITVIMGENAPWLSDVRERALSMPCQTAVDVGVDNMAQVMTESDLAIGAAGSTSWERCCLGLPTLIITLAENQESIAQSVVQCGAAMSLGDVGSRRFNDDLRELVSRLENDVAKLLKMSTAAARVADGCGVARVVEIMESDI